MKRKRNEFDPQYQEFVELFEEEIQTLKTMPPTEPTAEGEDIFEVALDEAGRVADRLIGGLAELFGKKKKH